MMNYIRNLLLGALLVGILSPVSYAQEEDELNIFGFSQMILNYRDLDYTTLIVNGTPTEVKSNSTALSFSLHQVNLFFQKQINPKTTFFLNLQASGSYSTSRTSGEFEVPEGWISFQLTDRLELKTGLLLPKFNNLNEIKNRLPLFPYLVRPIIYESLFTNLVKPDDFRPQQSYIQLSGYKNINTKYLFDYSIHLGNSESSFHSKIRAGDLSDDEETTTLFRGEDLNTAMMLGGRVGIENNLRTQKIGFSFTADEENKTKPELSVFKLPELITPEMGEIPRLRLGMDLSFIYKKFSFESELIQVVHDHTEIRKNYAFRNVNLNKYFVYANVTYNVNDRLYLFSTISTTKDRTYEFIGNRTPSSRGVNIFSIGSGWRINDVSLFKLQYISSQLPNNDYLIYEFDMITLGISTIF